MTKAVKKTRRLKKSVRKTLGALFLVSALVVAAIPTEGLRAEEGVSPQADAPVSVTHNPATKVTISKESMANYIPVIRSTDTIYTSEDGNYQFAYVQSPTSSTKKIAVILGYDTYQTLEGNRLVIPDTLDAYLQISSTQGTDGGYVAVGENKKPLYWEEIYYTTEIEKDAEGKDVEVKKEHRRLNLCYRDTASTWKYVGVDENGQPKNREPGEFYYKVDSASEYVDNYTVTGTAADGFKGYTKSVNEKDQWIRDAIVQYIGNQYLTNGVIPEGENSNYIDSSNPDKGIFANSSNIAELVVGDNLLGIGNCAFYHSTGLNSISLGNGLLVIGNSAFRDCISLNSIDMQLDSLIQEIGDHAFTNCKSLTEVVLPKPIKRIGDSTFEGCTKLTSVDLCSQNQSNTLSEMGYDVFKDCSSLQNITFPEDYAETIDISMFLGCSSLHYIASRNDNFNIKATDGYTFDMFKNMLKGEPVSGTFYLEGKSGSSLYNCARDNYFAFSYIAYNPESKAWESQNKYELTVKESGDSSVTYIVNKDNQLLNVVFSGTGKVETINFPEKIGPYGIKSIKSGVFQNQCNLKKVTIPSSIELIESNAFKGCHQLTDVLFASKNTHIEEDAFKTQDFDGTHKCGGSVETDTDNTPKVKLHFTGPISPDSGPFTYAMNESGRYNNGNQKEDYIIYYSGWPQNLEVRYIDGKSTLTDFPAFSDLGAGTKYTKDNYAYITDDYHSAAASAPTTQEEIRTENEKKILDAAKNIVIPEGVTDIKEGLFCQKEAADKTKGFDGSVDSAYMKTLTAYSLQEIGENDFCDAANNKGAEMLEKISLHSDVATIAGKAFQGCTGLTTVEITGDNQSIGDYAFKDCENLENVAIPASTAQLGIRPFVGCKKLANVNFQNSPYFICEDSMVFGLTNGVKTKLIECLEGKSGKYVRAAELEGITSMEKEAFAGTDVKEVDLSSSMITAVPERAFADTASLKTVKLPYTCTTLEAHAFQDSEVDYVEVPITSTPNLSSQAFEGMKKSPADVTLCVVSGSRMEEWAKLNGFDVTDMPLVNYYTVVFYDWNEELGKNTIVKEEKVQEGMDANPPTPLGKTGKIFDKWELDYHEISGDTTCIAQYIDPPEDYGKLKVTFEDLEGNFLKDVLVEPGGDVSDQAPKAPDVEGCIFTGWDRSLTNVTESFTTRPKYDELGEDEFVVRYYDKDDKLHFQAKVKSGEDAPDIVGPKVEGYNFTGWRPAITDITKDTDTYAQYEPVSGSGTGTGDGSGTGTGTGGSSASGNNSTGSATTYTLTVVNGSGSGSYVAGSQAIIVANDPAAGMEFSSWTISPTDTKIASKAISATVVTMPKENVTVTANYKKKSSTGSSTVSGNGSSSNSNRPNGSTGTLKNGGTTVVIDKNGLSNTGVVSATVNGSSDNFTIKITESSSASEAVLRALMAEYGNDLSNIKYFPMDITLYDSKGVNKITDTRGLSINITLPLPDSLITYAGNNKVAGVVDNRLDKLTPKFTTINGVSCVTFTAEHFSPYVIYADISNLSAGNEADSTPKTGDGIHPKWFLSIGLACISFVLFMQKDSSRKRKVKVKAA